MLYKFKPILKPTLWGGKRIAAMKHLSDAPAQVGESWELSAIPGSESVVAEGPDAGLTIGELVARDGARLVGRSNYDRYGNEFPLLVKFIDAAGDLSVQVHPDDSVAASRHGSKGKTELWYMLPGDPGAKLLCGFKTPMTRENVEKAVADGTLLDTVHSYTVNPGDVFFVSAGRVHSIGAGCFLVEIQQTSDLTYRLYDYGRVDSDGKPRPLHLDKALDVLDYSYTVARSEGFEGPANTPLSIAKCSYFTVDKITVDTTATLDLAQHDSFMILVGISGDCLVTADGLEIKLTAGETVLVSAEHSKLQIKTTGQSATLLMAYI